MQAGTTITRHVSVSDTSDQPLGASLYVGGAAITGGSFTPSDKGTPSELGTWSRINPTSLSLQPGKSAEATVTIAVPKDAADGERYGVIWAELPPSGGAIKTVNRVGVRIYLSVGNGSAPAPDFTIDALQAARSRDGKPSVTATVHNTGGRALDMSGTLSLSDGPGGLKAGPFPATLGTTLGIGQTEPVSIALPDAITGGPWTATLSLQSDLVKKTVTGRITFPAAGQTSAPVKATPKKTPKEFPVVASAAGALALLALLGVGYAVLRRRGRTSPE